MADRYLTTVNSPMARTLAGRLGLPRPTVLRRYRDGDQFLPGPVLVLGPEVRGSLAVAQETPTSDDAARIATLLSDSGLDVRRRHDDSTQRWGAIVLVLTEVDQPRDLSPVATALSPALKRLAECARVVTLSRSPEPDDAPAVAATRQGIDGFERSLAKELRYGATGNGIQLTAGADVLDPAVLAALRFFLSAKSAFIDGQILAVGPVPNDEQRTARRADGAVFAVDPPHPLAGKVAVVTGAARGIGAEVARTLARDGAKVVVVDVPAAGESLARIANEVKGSALQLDVTGDDAAARILSHAQDLHGGLHILVNNAGILRDKLLVNMSADKWDAVVSVNLESQLKIVDYLLTQKGFSESPRVVSLASTSGIAGNRGQTNYAFSKAGVIGHTRAFARRLCEIGGTANAVAPGFIETDMTASIPLVSREMARRISSLQQGGLPIDVAEAIAFLSSPGARGINGQVLRVCGQSIVGQ